MSELTRTVKDYSESTTIHGIGYIFESGVTALERLLWICVVCFGTGMAISLAIVAYINWKDNPVLTTVGTTGHPIEKVEFPAITICAQVHIECSKVLHPKGLFIFNPILLLLSNV